MQRRCMQNACKREPVHANLTPGTREAVWDVADAGSKTSQLHRAETTDRLADATRNIPAKPRNP
eukprot:9079440-Prorocentrum_lima.AAC.1